MGVLPPVQASPFHFPFVLTSMPSLRLRSSPRLLAAGIGIAAVTWALSPGTAQAAPELASLSLQELVDLEITSVSGYPEQISDAPASIFVISADDIRRSGARTLPEALRLAPNLEVARTSASTYAISARGMNSADNKLLVLLDGRILYTPLYSGVLWYVQDVVLEDVERIEVISGPGGTLWGSNAVNGVINIITRSASATQGTVAAAGAGNHDGRAFARYGAGFASGSWRIYAKTLDEGSFTLATGRSAADGRERTQAGFRVDWAGGFTLQGDTYRGHLDQLGREGARLEGSNVNASWAGAIAGGHARARAYFDRNDLDVPGGSLGTFRERLDIVDVSFQHDLASWHAQQVSWGAGYRQAFDRLQNIAALAYLPADLDLHWISVFAQDRMALSDTLDVTGGVKAEHNSYTGLETMPSLRLSWNPARHNLAWAALSRAVRTPSRLDRDLYSPAQPPYLIAGGPDFRSETADVAEIGYRQQPTARLSWSATAFVQRYRHLRSVEFIDARYLVVANRMEGTASGVEAWTTWEVAPQWRITAGGVYLHQRLHLQPGSTDPIGAAAAGNDPSVQWLVRSSWTLAHDVDLDVAIRHVGALPQPQVPGYTATDVRVAWPMGPRTTVSIVGENLFDPEHVEFGGATTGTQIPRTVFFNVSWAL
jgi:iron complex outermembrane receptor protein